MPLPDRQLRRAGLARWKKATVSHAAFEDWIGELEGSCEPDEVVSKRLAHIAKGHKPRAYSIQQVAIEGRRVTLTWDTGEDTFRERAGDFAALVRSAAAFGAKGAFYFLGTAGAEGDFAYSVVLDGKRSRVSALPSRQIMKLAYGPDYEAFVARVMALAQAGNSALEAMMSSLPQAAAPSKDGDALYGRVLARLEARSDAELAKVIAKYPGPVPDSQLRSSKTVRAQLRSPPNEETRGAALWTLGELERATAIPIAFEVLELKAPNEHLLTAALRVVAHATHAEGEIALQCAAEQLRRSRSPYVLSGAQAVLVASVHGALDATLEALLDKLPADRGAFVVAVLESRKRKALAPALARYAKRTKDQTAVELLARWKS